MKAKTTLTLLAGAASVCLLRNAAAQNAGALDQVDTVQQRRALEQATKLQYNQGDNAPEIYPGESDDVGPQSVLKIKPKMQWVEAFADSQYFYSDNVFLDHDNRQHSGVLASTVQLALAPTPYELGSGTLAPRLGYRHQWFDFFEYKNHTPNFNSADFNAQTVFVDERWTHENWIFGGGLDYTRLLTTSSYNQIYYEFVPRWEVRRSFPVCQNSSLSLAYEGYYHFSHVSAAYFFQTDNGFENRLDNALLASFNYSPCSRAIIQPYYRMKYTHFTSNIHREDFQHTIGLGLYCFITPQFTARAFVSYDYRQSSHSQAEYHKFDAGGGLNFTLRF